MEKGMARRLKSSNNSGERRRNAGSRTMLDFYNLLVYAQ
jgi:hypothetical protein